MNMLERKDRIINTLIIAFIVGVGVAVWYLPPAIAYWRSSEVYKRYHKVDGVEATYIKDFRVNDTLTIAVTLLQATDSAGWESLLQAFNIPEDVRLVFSQLNLNIFDWQSPRDHPEIRANLNDNKLDTGLTNNDIEICLMEFKERRIGIFHTQNENEVYAVTNYNFNNMINKTNTLKKTES